MKAKGGRTTISVNKVGVNHNYYEYLKEKRVQNSSEILEIQKEGNDYGGGRGQEGVR